MTAPFDIHHDLFGRGGDQDAFFETVEIVAIAGRAEAGDDFPAGLKGRLLTPPLFYSLAEGVADNRRINDALLAAAARLGASAAGAVEPKFGPAGAEELQRIKAAGSVAVVFSPRAQGVFGNDHVMVEMCRQAAALGLLVLVRSAPYSVNESLPRLWDLARACPLASMVVLGAFASWENIQLARWNGGGPANVAYDLSGLVEPYDLAALVQDVGAARLLFGSGGASGAAALLRTIERCAMPDADRAAVLGGNATALLGRLDLDGRR